MPIPPINAINPDGAKAMNARKGEAPYHEYKRCNRLINLSGRWSFTTREKTIEGPYKSRELAVFALEHYIIKQQASAPRAMKADEIPTLTQPI